MSAPASKLNLRPQERRLIAFVLIVVFVVLNIWLVWPLFGDWGQVKARQERARKTKQIYEAEIAKASAYRVRLRELENAGQSVVPEEQELDLVRTVDGQARMNRLNVIQSDPRPKQSMGTQTNRFFEEQYVTLHVTSDSEELVNFLVSLTSTNSLIRVKDLALKTADVAATRLDAHMTLVASYQRKMPSRGQAQASPTAANVTASTKPPTATKPAASAKPAAARSGAPTNRPPLTVSASSGTNRVRVLPSRTRLTNTPTAKP